MSLKIVLLSFDSAYARQILHEMKNRDVVPDAVVLFANPIPHTARSKQSLTNNEPISRLRRALAPGRQLKRRLWFSLRRVPCYRPFTRRVVASGLPGSSRVLNDLRRLSPDVLVLGSCGIIGPEVIETARLGVLNVHPGVLPFVRGLEPSAHSLRVGVPLGASAHLVDKRIDTGALIERRLLPVQDRASLNDLRKQNLEMAARLMAEVVTRTVAEGQIAASVPQTVRFPLHRAQTHEERLVADSLALNGRAHELFEKWKPLCLDETTWTLPPQAIEPPTPIALSPLDVDW